MAFQDALDAQSLGQEVSKEYMETLLSIIKDEDYIGL